MVQGWRDNEEPWKAGRWREPIGTESKEADLNGTMHKIRKKVSEGEGSKSWMWVQ